MQSLSDSMPGQSLTPLATTMTTTICHLPDSSAPSVTCLWNSVAFSHLTIWFPWSRPYATLKVKSCSSTQRPDPCATHSRDCPRWDGSTPQSGISLGSSTSCRWTSMPRVRLHPAPSPVHSETERMSASSSMSTQRSWQRSSPVVTHPLNSHVSVLACQPQADGLACPRFFFTPLPILCTQRSSTSSPKAGPTTFSTTRLPPRSHHICYFLRFDVL